MTFNNSVSICNYRKVSEVARRLGVSRQHVRNLINRGDLPAHRFGTLYVVPESAVEAYLESNRVIRHAA